MKKSIKICLGIGSITFGIGMILVIVGAALGKTRITSDAAMYTEYSETVTNVQSLDIDIDYGSVSIEKGTTFSVEVVGEENEFSSEVSNGIWKIKQKGKEKRNWMDYIQIPFLYDDSYRLPQINITIPESAELKNVEIRSGVGSFYIESIHTDNIVIEVGVAGFIIEELYVTNKAVFEVGTGNLEIYQAEVGGLTAESGVGRLYYEGIIHGDSTLDCGVGAMELWLDNEFDACYFDIDSGIGGVVIDGNSIHSGTIGDKNSKHRFYIECGIGQVRIDMK